MEWKAGVRGGVRWEAALIGVRVKATKSWTTVCQVIIVIDVVYPRGRCF